MLFRFEPYYDGEYLGAGILQALYDVFDEETSEYLCSLFDELPIPKYHSFSERHTCAFFTEYGMRMFKESIEKIRWYYDDFGYKTKCLIIEDDDYKDDIVFSDSYQVIIKESVIDSLRKIVDAA